MRLFFPLITTVLFSGCSLIPERWVVDTSVLSNQQQIGVVKTEAQESTKEIILYANTERLGKVEVGQSKVTVLEILGLPGKLDDDRAMADRDEEDGVIQQVLYLRTSTNDFKGLRALIFKADRLVGIGWSAVN